MFSNMDFLPTFAHIVGAEMPTDRPIDGVDQTDVGADLVHALTATRRSTT